ncbi:hypothetical protein B0H14DRAFT_1077918 [Mycena olivaceomarginata]|nr:hypothetical protein B0H14DRAFT_1077918 [Mycena olivaceomarginata]
MPSACALGDRVVCSAHLAGFLRQHASSSHPFLVPVTRPEPVLASISIYSTQICPIAFAQAGVCVPVFIHPSVFFHIPSDNPWPSVRATRVLIISSRTRCSRRCALSRWPWYRVGLALADGTSRPRHHFTYTRRRCLCPMVSSGIPLAQPLPPQHELEVIS